MNTLIIGVYANEKLIKKLNALSQSDSKLSIAAIKYSDLIGDGFKYNLGQNSTNLFLIPVGMYPANNLLLWKIKKIDDDFYIPFINIIIIKQISIILYVFYFSFKWYLKNKKKGKKVIVFSFLYLPFLISILPLKILKNIFIVSFVPDLPEYEFSYTSSKFSIKKMLIPIYVFLSKKIVFVNDFLVYITKYMEDYFGIKSSFIIEGFTDARLPPTKTEYGIKKNAIMYAGALYEKFGIRLLLDAFHEIKGDYQLWLFGNGDMEKEIKLNSLKDPRVIYWGNLPNNKILEYEKKAKLLVNPRYSSNKFTKYSFPSKLMEYMSSGTPVLTTRLLGIPNDYYDKMYYINSETKEGLKQAILTCLKIKQKELDLFGEKAKSYVLNHKNNRLQIEKLIEVIKNYLIYP